MNAVVCDPGSHTFRVGFARHGEPTVEMAASVGVPIGALDPGVRPDGRISYSASAQYDVDVTSLCVPREGEFSGAMAYRGRVTGCVYSYGVNTSLGASGRNSFAHGMEISGRWYVNVCNGNNRTDQGRIKTSASPGIIGVFTREHRKWCCMVPNCFKI